MPVLEQNSLNTLIHFNDKITYMHVNSLKSVFDILSAMFGLSFIILSNVKAKKKYSYKL